MDQDSNLARPYNIDIHNGLQDVKKHIDDDMRILHYLFLLIFWVMAGLVFVMIILRIWMMFRMASLLRQTFTDPIAPPMVVSILPMQREPNVTIVKGYYDMPPPSYTPMDTLGPDAYAPGFNAVPIPDQK